MDARWAAAMPQAAVGAATCEGVVLLGLMDRDGTGRTIHHCAHWSRVIVGIHDEWSTAVEVEAITVVGVHIHALEVRSRCAVERVVLEHIVLREERFEVGELRHAHSLLAETSGETHGILPTSTVIHLARHHRRRGEAVGGGEAAEATVTTNIECTVVATPEEVLGDVTGVACVLKAAVLP